MEQKLEQKTEEKNPKDKRHEKERQEVLVRILSTDINGERNLYAGLARIKGISFSISNAICYKLQLDKRRKIGSLSKEEIDKISNFIKNLSVPDFMKNRRFDFDSGETKHLITTDLDLKREFDIKRFKKIKSYKGIRHSRGLPVRGQRTKSHFRKQGRKKAVGVRK